MSKRRRFHLCTSDPYARSWVDRQNRETAATACGSTTFPDMTTDADGLREYAEHGLPVCRLCWRKVG